MRSASVFAVAVLALVLALSSAQNVYAGQWITYDDGIPDGWFTTAAAFAAVRFSLPSGWSEARVLTARYYIAPNYPLAAFRVHIYGRDGMTDLIRPLPVQPISDKWLDVDLTPFNVVVSADFYVAMEWMFAVQPAIGIDATSPDFRSYQTPQGRGPPEWYRFDSLDLMIRAEVDAIGPVGGAVMPMNTLAILAIFFQLGQTHSGLVASQSWHVGIIQSPTWAYGDGSAHKRKSLGSTYLLFTLDACIPQASCRVLPALPLDLPGVSRRASGILLWRSLRSEVRLPSQESPSEKPNHSGAKNAGVSISGLAWTFNYAQV